MSGHEPGYVLTPLAEADLDGIWDYVAERFGFDVADRVLDSLHDAFRLLAENPGMRPPGTEGRRPGHGRTPRTR